MSNQADNARISALSKRAAAKAELARLLGDRYPSMLRAQMETAPMLGAGAAPIETPEFIASEVKKAEDAVAAVRGVNSPKPQ